MSLLLASALDVTVVVAVALAAARLLRRRAAALRHAVLAAAVTAALFVPLLEAVVPAWEIPLMSSSTASTSTLRLTSAPVPESPAVAVDTAGRGSTNWPAIVAVVWAAGAAFTGAGLLVGFVRLARAARRSRTIASGPWRDSADVLAARAGVTRRVALLQSPDPAQLLTWGLRRPRILIPAGAGAWSDERREVVLAHEMAHIRRGDWALQILAEALRAMHWFNPLVWIACRRLREDSEYACDDAVLDRGIAPAAYATHLLAVARQAIGQRDSWVTAPAIAHPSTLERRISAMLTHTQRRRPLTRRAGALASLGALLVAVPVAAVSLTERTEVVFSAAAATDVALVAPGPMPDRAPAAAPARAAGTPTAAAAQQEPASFSGTMLDASGGILPGVDVSFTDLQFGVRYTAVSDGTGVFRFRDVQPGRYQLEAGLPGFATVSNVIQLAPAADVVRRLTLPIGSLEEKITVVCAPRSAAAALQPLAFDRRGEGRFVPGSGGTAWARLNPPAPPAFAAPQGRPGAVRVGGQIKVPRKITDVNPVCPNALVPAGGTLVRMVGRIGVDGYMNEVRQVEGDPKYAPAPPPFVESAMEAVRQWAFTPTLLNNQPVEVNVTMNVYYTQR